MGCGGMACVGFGDDLGALRGGGCGIGVKRRMKGGQRNGESTRYLMDLEW